MAKAIRIHSTGGPATMRWDDVSVAPPGRGEVLLRHTAIGVNFIDTYHRSGLYPLLLPAVLGMEAAGVVQAAAASALTGDGSFDARGDDGRGGTVTLSGANVTLAQRARVDVSGAVRREEPETGRINVRATETLTLESGSALAADGPAAGEVRLESGGDLTMQSDARVTANGADGPAGFRRQAFRVTAAR